MRDRLRAVTRDTLLRASERIFAETGIDGARMGDTGAGVAVGRIYTSAGRASRPPCPCDAHRDVAGDEDAG